MKKFVCCIGACVLDVLEHENYEYIGGDSANQALLLSRLGLQVSLCAKLGKDDAAEKIKTILAKAHIDTTALVCSDQETTTVSTIHLDEKKESSFTVSGHAHRHLRFDDLNLDFLMQHQALSLGSLFTLHELEEDGLLTLLQKAKQHHLVTFSDTTKDRHHKGLSKVAQFLPYFDYFMPSYEEAMDLTNEKEPDKIAQVLLQYDCKTVILKLGSQGACLYQNNKKINGTPFPCNVVDTTGAGDNFCAGFIASILFGLSDDQALENACYFGARATESIGANQTVFDLKDLPHPLY